MGSTDRTRLARAALRVLVALWATGCSNPFAPSTTKPPDSERPPAEKATTPEIAMDNLARSFNERDKDLYESILDPAFWFTETDCRGDLVFANGFEEELEIMGSRDSSSRGIFDRFRTIDWDFQTIERRTELGREYPDAYEGDPDGHPEEDWEVFRGRVEILLLETKDEGYRVTGQVMNIKLRRGDDGLWRIVRWADDPLSGDCGDATESQKPAAAAPAAWGAVRGGGAGAP
ncbi:MAG: hypothetical protein ABIL09_02855 [Gemmatimonadota bacterium]